MTDRELFEQIVGRAATSAEGGIAMSKRCEEVEHEAGVGVRVVHVVTVGEMVREYTSVVLVFNAEGRLVHSYGCEGEG